MHKVYSIKKKKYSKKYFVNFVDFTFESIELDIDIISKYCITVDSELDDDTIAKAMDSQQYKNVKLAAYNYVSYKPRSETEVRRKLEEKNFGINHIDYAISFLYEFKLLDDEEYTKTFILNYIKRNPSGKFKLKQELRKRGIEENLISKSIINNYPNNDVLELAKIAADKHLRKVAHKPKEKQKNLIIDFLSRRGFEWDIILKTTENLFQ